MKEITAAQLRQRLQTGEKLLILDVREAYETEVCTIGGTCLPMSQLLERLNEIPRDRPVVVHCRSGARSCAVVDSLTTRYGFTNLINLKGGISAWQNEVDPGIHCD